MIGARRPGFRASQKKHIGSVDPDALKIPARRAECSLTENARSPFHAEPEQFQILLPCAEHTPQETHSTTAGVEEEDVRTQAPTVLVAEDKDLATSRMLRKKCFTVIEASDGSAALDLMRAHRDHIDVILLDVTLRAASSRE